MLSKHLNDIDVKNSVGVVCKSKSFGDFRIIEYNGCKDVLIEFLATGYKKVCDSKEVRTGKVKDKLLPTVLGVGIVGDKYQTKINDKNVKEYRHWFNMLNRCYGEKLHLKQPTYVGCITSENFKHYTYFYEWCQEQLGFGNSGWHLDKDLLIKGNKLYSEDNCVFLPIEINSLILGNDKIRGNYHIGVSWHKATGKYCAVVNEFNKQKHLGLFESEIEAFYKYKQAKEQQIKVVAEMYKGKIDNRAYDALMNYQVEIND